MNIRIGHGTAARAMIACLSSLALMASCVPQEVLAFARDAQGEGTSPATSVVEATRTATEGATVADAEDDAGASQGGIFGRDVTVSADTVSLEDKGVKLDGKEDSERGDDAQDDASADGVGTSIADAAEDSAAASASDSDDEPVVASVADALPSVAATSANAQIGTSSISLRAEWRSHHISSDPWTEKGGQDAGTNDGDWYQRIALRLNNADGVDGHVNYRVALQGNMEYVDPTDGKTWTSSAFPAASTDGAYAGTSGRRRAMEDVCIWLTGTIARCYGVRYTVLTSAGREYTPISGLEPWEWNYKDRAVYAPFANKEYTGVDGAWTRDSLSSGTSYGSSLYYGYADVGVRKLTVELFPRKYTHVIRVRYENADGSWSGWQTARSSSNAYASVVPAWTRAQDATYQAASVAAYVAGYDNRTTSVDVRRRVATNTFRVRYQQPDGSWGAWENVTFKDDRVGTTRVWSREEDDVYKAVTATIVGTAAAQTVDVSVERKSVTATFDANGGVGGGTVSKLVGSTYGDDLPTATSAGLMFVGWYTQRVGGEPVASDTTATNAVYYARWMTIPQLKISVPVAMHYVAHDDGTVSGPGDGVVAIANNGTIDAGVSMIRVEGDGDFAIVRDSPGEREISLSVTPGNGTPDALGAYVGGGNEPTVRNDWLVDAGARLFLNGLTGRTGAADLTADTLVGVVHWTFAARDS